MLRAWWRFLDSNQGHTGYEPAALPPELNRQAFCWGKKLRRSDSNRRPSGYEPDELPLLHAALRGYRTWHCLLGANGTQCGAGVGVGEAVGPWPGLGLGRCTRLRSWQTAYGRWRCRCSVGWNRRRHAARRRPSRARGNDDVELLSGEDVAELPRLLLQPGDRLGVSDLALAIRDLLRAAPCSASASALTWASRWRVCATCPYTANATSPQTPAMSTTAIRRSVIGLSIVGRGVGRMTRSSSRR